MSAALIADVAMWRSASPEACSTSMPLVVRALESTSIREVLFFVLFRNSCCDVVGCAFSLSSISTEVFVALGK